YLVMEFVEGETLSQRLKSGAFAVEDALDIGKQIAEALEAAHEKGIVHRDLKPANVMIREDGTVKVLDFGLAKAMAEDPSGAADADSPTITANYTRPGVVLGTAAYMSPEQARGRPLDKRTDIWSFGIMLFECLTGQRLFQGETANDSMGAIMHKEPDWSLLPRGTPPTVRLLLRRCLSKDRRRRLQAIGDARVELEEVGSSDELLHTETTQGPSNRPIVSALPWVLCGVFAVVMTIMLTRDSGKTAAPIVRHVKKSVLTFPPNTSLKWRGTQDSWGKIGYSHLLAISRDGRRIIQTVQEGKLTSLYLKDDEDLTAGKVRGTEGARGAFFSPDGLWVGFVKENHMLKVRLPGGTPQPICDVNSTAFDATWLDDGTIIYSTDHGLRRVSSDGGEPQTLTSIDIDKGISGHNFPHVIDGTRWVMFTATTDTGQHAALLSLDDNSWNIIKQRATDARYVGGGHLVFARNGELLASPFDPDDPTTLGTEAPIVRGVHAIPGKGGAVVHLFDTSMTGVLVYAPSVDPPGPDALVWVDHQGNEEEIVQGPGQWMHQRLSPDGQHILFNIWKRDGMLDLHIYDFQRDQIDPLTHSGHTYDAEWSPDGRTVCFNSLDTKGRTVFLVPTDFSGPPRSIIDALDTRLHLCQWSDDGSTLVFFDRSTRGGIWTASPDGRKKLSELMNTSLGEAWARISPDGRLIAYVGFDDSGHRDIYVQAYPDLGPRIRVSKNGGGEPRWARDSRTLYFREAGKIFKASILIEPRLEVASVATLPIADVYDSSAAGHQHYDLSLDGTKFLMVKHGRRVYPTRVHVIENWTAELNKDSTQ
ncbi:MAG: serine/threonine-protein kinase, partial [Planctomycetes bacterium]|nr:serine/threonine-protein kinase [Planctomycetota bacterium]